MRGDLPARIVKRHDERGQFTIVCRMCGAGGAVLYTSEAEARRACDHLNAKPCARCTASKQPTQPERPRGTTIHTS